MPCISVKYLALASGSAAGHDPCFYGGPSRYLCPRTTVPTFLTFLRYSRYETLAISSFHVPQTTAYPRRRKNVHTDWTSSLEERRPPRAVYACRSLGCLQRAPSGANRTASPVRIVTCIASLHEKYRVMFIVRDVKGGLVYLQRTGPRIDIRNIRL